jgi:hypothetical protein
MPSIDIEFLKYLKGGYSKYVNFIETGTYKGDTTFCMEQYFMKVYTIEIKKEFYDEVKGTYKGEKVKFYHGDSSTVLIELLPSIVGKSLIFLDGHWSAGETGKGEKDTPLYEEIGTIMSLHEDEAIIIVDDVRLFGKGPNKGDEICDWEEINIERILRLVESRMTDHYFLPSYLDPQDRMIIHISQRPN